MLGLQLFLPLNDLTTKGNKSFPAPLEGTKKICLFHRKCLLLPLGVALAPHLQNLTCISSGMSSLRVLTVLIAPGGCWTLSLKMHVLHIDHKPDFWCTDLCVALVWTVCAAPFSTYNTCWRTMQHFQSWTIKRKKKKKTPRISKLKT